ncbi:MAG: aldehyde ferredoxin oxidoreductase family protein [Candidatus Helarchaeota archaeon]|nr:aldehyde ferredoxin oxidoreductase family protein [Candidatus Helarchaeota archaeon]
MNGKILRVNLTEKRGTIEKLQEEIIRKYLGGAGIAMRMFYDEVPPEVQPFDPENKLFFMIGPLTGLLPSTTRHAIVGKSPLTNILGESYSGGYWGYELRKTGVDGIIIEGKAEKPVFIWIYNGTLEIKDAAAIWELDAIETQAKIQEQLGDKKVRVACIGQAGVKLVKYACIMNERDAAGRCGLGAVMGSKNLKAIAVRGSHDPKELVADKGQFRELLQQAAKKISENFFTTSVFGAVGTAGNMEVMAATGDVPHGYWKVGAWAGDRNFKGRVWKKLIAAHEACYFCSVKCKKVCELKDDAGQMLFHGAGPEYETLAGFGPLLLNDDFLTVLKANDLCNRYGLDTISCSETIGFAMECWERGILTDEATEGLNLEWGRKDSIIQLIEKIAFRQGIGNILAEGVQRTATYLGKSAQEFALTVKGLEVAHHDSRAYHSMSLAYAVGTHGHNDAFTVLLSTLARPDVGFPEPVPRHSKDPELNAKAQKVMQDISGVVNSLTMCHFVEGVIPWDLLLKSLNTIMGLNFTQDELFTIGERIFNLKRMYGVRCGISKKDDVLPNRFTKEPLHDGGAAGKVPDLERILVAYYQLRGWSADGIPTDETMRRLDLIVD